MTTPATPPPPAPVPPEWDYCEGQCMSRKAPCGARTEDARRNRFICTREPNHTGPHIACADQCNLHIWTLPAEPTASESSGDVHLANALAEVERLKAELTEAKRIIDSHWEYVKRLRSERDAALARAETAKRERDEAVKVVRFYADVANFSVDVWQGEECLAEPAADHGLTEAYSSTKFGDFGIKASEFLDSLATPSPAPVAGKTNPPEISSHVVDAPVAVGEKSCPWHSRYMVGCLACQAAGGEKDSAGPTPRTDEARRSFEWWRDCHETAPNYMLVEADFARTLERELTASESLRREAEESVRQLREAGLRIIAGKYVLRSFPEGPEPCAHGYANGDACPNCDRARFEAPAQSAALTRAPKSAPVSGEGGEGK